MNKSFALIGAGGHAKVIIEIIEEMGAMIEMINDGAAGITTLHGYPVKAELPALSMPVIIAVGSNRIRKRIASEIPNSFGTAIHPKANLSGRCKIEEGTVVMAGATVNSDTRIGKHCIINTNASIDHDCVIADFVHISPGVSLAGNVAVGEGTQVGIGSSVIPGIKIGKWATIGAGAAVIADVPDHAVVVGVPGKIIKYKQETNLVSTRSIKPSSLRMR
jgi:sugar O-acyltransferase (sialic acid O-acetyltransferase NeuD family)